MLGIWELEKREEKEKWMTRVVNMCNNHLLANQMWTGVWSNTRRKALDDADWDNIIRRRVITLGELNAHSPERNVQCTEKRDAAGLE